MAIKYGKNANFDNRDEVTTEWEWGDDRPLRQKLFNAVLIGLAAWVVFQGTRKFREMVMKGKTEAGESRGGGRGKPATKP